MSTFNPIPLTVAGRLGSVDDTEALGGRDPREPEESALQDADITVDVVVAQSAEKVWLFISDVGRMGAWSQEMSSAEWVGGATGPAVGARFRSHGKGWPDRSELSSRLKLPIPDGPSGLPRSPVTTGIRTGCTR